MSQTFILTERIVGFVLRGAAAGEEVQIQTREALSSLDGSALEWRLEQLHAALFRHVPDLPIPSQIDHLLLVIAHDLTVTAYVNELQPVARIRVGRSVAAGEQIFDSDVSDMLSFDLGVPIPDDAGVVVFRSHGWRRSLMFDFTPLIPEGMPRQYDLSRELARQTVAVIRRRTPPVATLSQAISELEGLLRSNTSDESKYQELLTRYPWLLGGQHKLVERHTALDDRNIPDFTGVRARDECRDIFEIKPPSMRCFRQDGRFSAEFNAAWEQAERYLTFVRRNADYLRSEKNLIFNNPRCFLLVGWQLSDAELRRLHDKESHNPSISVLTYEQLVSVATAFRSLLERAGTTDASVGAG